jgi:hypothetical protein
MSSSGMWRCVDLVWTDLPPKRRFKQYVHSATSQKTAFFDIWINFRFSALWTERKYDTTYRNVATTNCMAALNLSYFCHSCCGHLNYITCEWVWWLCTDLLEAKMPSSSLLTRQWKQRVPLNHWYPPSSLRDRTQKTIMWIITAVQPLNPIHFIFDYVTTYFS